MNENNQQEPNIEELIKQGEAQEKTEEKKTNPFFRRPIGIATVFFVITILIIIYLSISKKADVTKEADITITEESILEATMKPSDGQKVTKEEKSEIEKAAAKPSSSGKVTEEERARILEAAMKPSGN